MFIFVHMGNFLSTKQFSKLVKFIICFIVSKEQLLAKKMVEPLIVSDQHPDSNRLLLLKSTSTDVIISI